MTAGLPTVAPLNTVWYKALFTYLPTAVSLAFDPMLKILASYHCMMGPYQTLNRRDAPSPSTLSIDYDMSPPHFQLMRALYHSNFPLAALTAALVVGRLLPIAFAGLFSATGVEFRDNSTEAIVFPTFGFTGPITGISLEMYYILADNLQRGLPLPEWTTSEYFVLSFADSADDLLSFSGPTHGIGIDVSCELVPSDNLKLSCDPSADAPSVTYCPGTYYITAVNDSCWEHVTPYNNVSLTQDFPHISGDCFLQSANCTGTFFAMWLQRPADTRPVNASSPSVDKVDAVALKCNLKENIVALNATVSGDGEITDFTITRRFTPLEVEALYPAYTPPTARLPHSFIDSIRKGLLAQDEDNDADDIRWLDYLARTLDPRLVRNGTAISHVPDTTYLAAAFEDVIRRLFAITVELNVDLLDYGDALDALLPAVVYPTRVVVSPVMFAIAAGILLFIMAVLVPLYWGSRGGRFKGHLPRSLGTMYALLYASNAKEECGSVQGRDPTERAEALRVLGYRYGFGVFVDASGKQHVGVHREVPSGSLYGERPKMAMAEISALT